MVLKAKPVIQAINRVKAPYIAPKIKLGALDSIGFEMKHLTDDTLQIVSKAKNTIKMDQVSDIKILFYDTETILNRSIVFGPKEYEKLSQENLNKLREYAKLFREKNDSMQELVNFATEFGKIFSEHIHEKYPNGFIFVSVGRSPALVAKYLEFQGEDVKYCAISGLNSIGRITPTFLQKYKKYLDSIGLTKELAETTKKPIIISDYAETGASLRNFQYLLALPQIGICESHKVKYIPINPCSMFNEDSCFFSLSEWNSMNRMYASSFHLMKHKSYVSIPKLQTYAFDNPEYSSYRTFDKYYQNGNRFEEDFKTKMINFIIADSTHKNS